jgi:hypothetical protein
MIPRVLYPIRMLYTTHADRYKMWCLFTDSVYDRYPFSFNHVFTSSVSLCTQCAFALMLSMLCSNAISKPLVPCCAKNWLILSTHCWSEKPTVQELTTRLSIPSPAGSRLSSSSQFVHIHSHSSSTPLGTVHVLEMGRKMSCALTSSLSNRFSVRLRSSRSFARESETRASLRSSLVPAVRYSLRMESYWTLFSRYYITNE